YRVGPTGEREEWINLRVALYLRDLLLARGAKVIMTRVADVAVPLETRARMAVENNADVFVSIHHNATADRTVNFPIIYYHGNASENKASVQLGKCLARQFVIALFNGNTPVSLVSDHTIFPTAGTAVLRHSYGIPGVIGEASFFSHPAEEQRLKDEKYNQKEAYAYLKALEDFFSDPTLPILERYSTGKLPPFPTLQEAERMQEIAKRWYIDFIEGKQLLNRGDAESLQQAYELFTRSARSFPDSYLARECHAYRAFILEQQGKYESAVSERRRVAEYYVPLPFSCSSQETYSLSEP
ncbi:MAG: N-acetylmuramoyl-L-alanine amidase, partial [Candidatus Sumerlaeia bacterium]|nr:N-acetylmuramoyl-L-alanine amidase [Candidatus Sumerlaeia bacterium]